MKSFMKRGMAAALCICMLFATACGDSGGSSDTPMGRYVESRLDYPEPEGKNLIMQRQRADGSIDAYFSDEMGISFQCFNTKDGEKWNETEVLWKLPESQMLNSLAYDKDDNIYISAVSYEGGTTQSFVYKVEDDGTLTRINVKLQDENGRPLKFDMVESMAIAENGNLLLGQFGGGAGEYKADGSFVRLYGAESGNGNSSGFAVSGNKLYIIDSEANAILAFSTEDGSMLQSITFDSFASNTSIAAGAEGAIYLYNRNGIFRMADGGSVWEKLVDGSLTSMIIPSVYFGEFIEGTSGEFYLSGGDGQGVNQLYKYVYDKTIASLPEKEIVVFTLNENRSLRQAAGEFQRNHQDTRVNVQVALDEDSAVTASDAVRSLNTELLNGKGPDVILLDGMPVDSYIEKGVLADLTGILKDMKYEKTMNKTIAETYKNKEGIFAIPTMIRIPALVTDKANAEGLTSLDALAKFAESHSDKPLIGNKSAQNLMRELIASCAPAWIEGDKIDENGLKSFLERIKEIADTPSPSYAPEEQNPSASDNYSMVGGGLAVVASGSGGSSSEEDLFHWAFGRAHALIKEIGGSGRLTGMITGMRKVKNSTILLLPGQAENVYIPNEIVGINAKSTQMDSAKDFVQMLLSEELQKKTMDSAGLPLNLAAFDAYISETDESIYISMGGSEYDENEELSGGMPTAEEKEPIRALYNAVKTPYKTDDILAGMILNEAQGYFTGEKGIAKTILDIQEATRLYLSE